MLSSNIAVSQIETHYRRRQAACFGSRRVKGLPTPNSEEPATFCQVNNGHNILMFFRSQQRTNGYEDLLAIMNWCNSHGLLHNSTFAPFLFGVEGTSASGRQPFSVNGYSASWSNIFGGGPGI